MIDFEPSIDSSSSLQNARPDSPEVFADALEEPTPQAAARAWQQAADLCFCSLPNLDYI